MYVVAELDYLLASRLGVDEELTALEELAGGAYDLLIFDAADMNAAAEVIAQYRDLGIGIADASLVVLAQRFARSKSSRSTAVISASSVRSTAVISICCRTDGATRPTYPR